MTSLLRFLKPYWLAASVALTMLILSTAADLATPTLVQRIIDVGVAHKDTTYILNTTLLMAAITLASVVLSVGNSYYSVQAAQRFSADLRRALFVKIQFLSFQNFDQWSTGSLLVRLTSDITQVQMVIQLLLRLMTRAPLLMLAACRRDSSPAWAKVW